MSKILIVDDDQDLVDHLEEFLTSENHVIEVAHSAELAQELLKVYVYELIILDWGLPGLSGVELLKNFRNSGGQAHVLMLTGKETITDKEVGLNAGADDYLTKPFHLRELSARVRALLRRPTGILGSVITVGDLSLDTANCCAMRAGKTIELLAKEYALLEFLIRHPDQLFDSDTIIDRVWHSERNVGPETVRTNITRLRKKIDTEGKESLIKNVRGLGYKLETP